MKLIKNVHRHKALILSHVMENWPSPGYDGCGSLDMIFEDVGMGGSLMCQFSFIAEDLLGARRTAPRFQKREIECQGDTSSKAGEQGEQSGSVGVW